MKIAFRFLVLFLAVVCLCSCDSGINDKVTSKRFENLRGIKDYGNLKSLGVGVVSNGARSVDTSTSLKLVGFDENGAYKVISFLDEDGNTVNQTYSLINFKDFNSFVLFQFAPPEYFAWLGEGEIDWSRGCGSFDEDYSLYYHDMFSMRYKWSAINNFLASNSSNKSLRNEFSVYVLDKKSGNIYELIDENGDMVYPSFHIESDPDELKTGMYYSTNNYSGFEAVNVALNEERTVTKMNFRMSIVNQELRLEKLQDSAVFNNWISGGWHDRYGNAYSGDKDQSQDFRYLINNDGQLKAIGSGSGFMGMNNIYYYNGNQCINENGELAATSFVPSNSYYCLEPSKNLIKTTNNDSYYFENDHVVKVSFLDDEKIEYTIDTIALENFDPSAKYSVSNGRLVYLSSSVIAYYSPEDGKNHILSDQYFYNSMTVLFDGSIEFSAVDTNFNAVKGTILADGTVNTSVSQSYVTIITMLPLN